MIEQDSLAECEQKLTLEQVQDDLSKKFWNLEELEVYRAREEFGVLGDNVTVAVIDTGIESNHPELKDKIIGGYNIELDNESRLEDKVGHGTNVAGIIAGKTTGVAPQAKIFSLKIGDERTFKPEMLIDSLEFCLTIKPDIINVSSGFTSYSRDMEHICERLAEKGIAIVAAAGNNSTGAFFPAIYEKVVSVASVNQKLMHCIFSSIWPSVDISAPGYLIITPDLLTPEGLPLYKKAIGTSAACPHITGVLSLALSLLKKKHGNYYSPDPQKVVRALKETALDKSHNTEEAHNLLRMYQHFYDKRKVFLRDPSEVINAVYGAGIAKAYRLLSHVNKEILWMQ